DMSTTDRDQAIPMGLRERVMAASLLARGIGQPVPAVPEIPADEAFAPDAEHVESTQGSAVRQAGRSPAQTLDEWRRAADHTLELVRAPGGDRAADGCAGRIA